MQHNFQLIECVCVFVCALSSSDNGLDIINWLVVVQEPSVSPHHRYTLLFYWRWGNTQIFQAWQIRGWDVRKIHLREGRC